MANGIGETLSSRAIKEVFLKRRQKLQPGDNDMSPVSISKGRDMSDVSSIKNLGVW